MSQRIQARDRWLSVASPTMYAGKLLLNNRSSDGRMREESLCHRESHTVGSLTSARHALVMMGGIGDFLHYLTRLPGFLREKRLAPSDLHIFVESLVPDQAEAIFTKAFPGLSFSFLPPAIHWVNTFPLLTPSRKLERINRPVYRHVESLGFQEITDWFLPFLCSKYGFDVSPLLRIIRFIPQRPQPYVVISARDKGFLWWPSQQTCKEVHELVTGTHRAIYVGTPNERISEVGETETLPSVLDALALSYHADLFIGTDTGLATMRELTGKKNIYCISCFWLEELMVRYGYIDSKIRDRAKSVFAFNRADLLNLLAAELDVQSKRR